MDCEFNEKTIWILISLVWVFGGQILKLLKKLNPGKSEAPAPPKVEPKAPEVWEEPVEDDPTTTPGPVDPLAAFRDEYEERHRLVSERLAEMRSRIVHERHNQAFADTLGVYMPKELKAARDELTSNDPDTLQRGADRVEHVELLLTLVEYMLEQRRHPTMQSMLGDADRLADDCYRPLLVWAQSQGVKTSSNYPAVVFGDYDLSIATGLIPTSVAPIFLPADFFERIAWWPGLTHEIGHDFYNSVPNFDASLRADLELPPAEVGAQLVPVSQGGIALSDIRGAFGAWLEELFCDVFGVMMSGPAYLVTMIEIFADPDDRESVLTTPLNGHQSGLDYHPPAHLRFLLASKVLSEVGFKNDADALMLEWLAANELEEVPEHIYLATTSGFVRVPIEPLIRINEEIGMRMYRGPLSGLNGRGLSGISGLDYGPHRHNESSRARDALLEGQVPQVRDTRAIMSGAVLAAKEKPQQQAAIIRLAREAIPELGSIKGRAGAYDVDSSPGVDTPAGEPMFADLVGGLILADIMRRPGNRHQRGNFVRR